jgi:hypothetical protein
MVRTEIPTDGVFHFSAVARAEGGLTKGGLRVTIPRPIVRGLEHLGWSGAWLRVRIGEGDAFMLRARHPRPVQAVLSLPRRRRGAVVAGEPVQLTVTALR